MWTVAFVLTFILISYLYEQLPAQAVMDHWKWIGIHHLNHQSKLIFEYLYILSYRYAYVT